MDLLELDRQNRHANGILYTLKDLKPFLSQEITPLVPFVTGNDSPRSLKPPWYVKSLKLNYKGYVIAGGCFCDYHSDIDIFIHKDHEATLNRLIMKFKPLGKMTFTKHCITFNLIETIASFRPVTIQIILRKYKSIAEILYGFDIGASQIAYNGTYWFTVMSKFAYETGYIIADTTRRSTTYEHRLQKYVYGKGFKLLLPFCRFGKVRTPYFNLTHNSFCSTVKDGYAKISDYNNSEGITYQIRKVLNGVDNVNINDEDIKTFFKNKAKSYDWYKWVIGFDRNLIFDDSYRCQKIKEAKTFCLDQIRGIRKWEWITSNPGTQLTGSLNPIIESPQEWYGEFYHPPFSIKDWKYRKDIPFLLMLKVLPLPLDIIEYILKMVDDFKIFEYSGVIEGLKRFSYSSSYTSDSSSESS